ncbi:MAG: hypothetical protein K8R86_11975 [Bacteroidales bacterium]|nr:hypothetical protein [Bacteroidales bacterium]
MKNLILSLVMLFVGSGMVMGQTATLSVEASDPVNSESIVNFQIKCDVIDDEVSTFQWFFQYDPEVLTPVDIVNYHEEFPSYEWMNNLSYGPDIIILTWLSSQAKNQVMKTGEVICELQFKYTGGKTELKWAKADDVTITSKNIVTAMWTQMGEIYYLTLKNASIGSE